MMDEVRISTQAQPSILLVDDSFVLRDQLKAQAFEERGFRVCVAGDGDEGLAVYRREKTDYAVLDLHARQVGPIANRGTPRRFAKM
ncbi:MAG: hypothetical protein U0905_06740 [Pirellulales bacterium]